MDRLSASGEVREYTNNNSFYFGELISELISERGCLPIFGVLANPNRVKYLLDYKNPTHAYKKVFK